MPTKYFSDNAVKWKNCQYYPYRTTTYDGPAVRYDTQGRKFEFIPPLTPYYLVYGRFCIPTSESLKNATVNAFMNNFYEKYDIDKYTSYVADLINVWYIMAICVGGAFIIGIIYLLILRCCAGVIIWGSILAILAIIGGGGYWVYFVARNKYQPSDKNYDYLTYGAYILWGLDGLFFLIVLCCCSRIRLAVAIMKVTSQFIYGTPSVLLLPIIFTIICCVWIGGWVVSAVFLMSIGEIKPRPSPFQFASTVVWSQQTRYLFFYHLFGALWVNAFIIGV
jgi:hypothetical protein